MGLYDVGAFEFCSAAMTVVTDVRTLEKIL